MAVVDQDECRTFPEVRDAIRALHSYELPECVAIGIEDGSLEYMQWLGIR